MSKRAFDKIAEGLDEAVAVARGEAAPAKLHVPPEIDVRALRRRLRMTQEEFARQFGFSLNQIRDWEQGRNRPLGVVRTYLMLIGSAPDHVMKLLADARKDLAA